MIDFQKELNSQQLEVVLHGNGPCLVLAGAGSGKTRTITYRVAYLLEQGVKPENILLVTFTNKAASEMKKRVEQLVGFRTSDFGGQPSSLVGVGVLPWSGTFHHIAYRILRRYAPLIGYQNNFTVLDSDDSQALIKLSLKDYKPNETGYKKFPSAKVLQSIISYGRNAELVIDKALETRYPNWLEFGGQIKNIASAYDKKKKSANAMDFDDLLVNLLNLLTLSTNSPLEGGGGVLVKFASQFQYILVDEYQDTNKVQAAIISKLSSKHNNVLVVGDDAQSIYSFRAADINNILRFEKQYPNAKIFKLEINYRSSQEILDVANNIIANNVRQLRKVLKTPLSSPPYQGGDRGGLRPLLQPQLDQQTEARFIAQKIAEMLDRGTPASEIAVLFRAAFHSQMLEMELVKAGVSYDYRGGLRFFERAHIKDVLAYLRILNNLADTAAWTRVLTHEDGIGPVAAQRIIEEVKQASQVEQIKQIGYALGDRVRQGWHNFVQIWDEMINVGKAKPVDLIKAVLQSNYQNYLSAEYIDSKDRLEDIEQLALFAKQYESLEEFLAEASLQEGFNTNSLARASEKNNSGEKVVLSTIHQAKGLEWTSVFVINLASGAFPNERSIREDNGLEEERRLFYVAVTRAKKHLYLTYPMAGGSWGDSLGGPSMFLEEISQRLLDDRSLLIRPSLVLDDKDADVRYVNEEDDKPFNIKPGSFLRDINDL